MRNRWPWGQLLFWRRVTENVGFADCDWRYVVRLTARISGILVIAAAIGASCRADSFVDALVKDLCGSSLGYKTLYVSSVTSITGEENAMCGLYRERVTAQLVQCSTVTVVDRSSLPEATREIALSQTGAAGDSVEIQEGKLLNAQAMLNITVAQLKEGTELSCKLVDVQTSRIAFARIYRDFEESDLATQAAKPDDSVRSPEAGSAPPPSVQVEVLRLTPEQRKTTISFQYRGKLADKETEYQASLFQMRRKDPARYTSVLETRKGMERIGRDSELYTLFVANFGPAQTWMQAHHPFVWKACAKKASELERRRPGKTHFVRQFIRIHEGLISAEPMIVAWVADKNAEMAEKWSVEWHVGVAETRENRPGHRQAGRLR
jgi:hypothetical protein